MFPLLLATALLASCAYAQLGLQCPENPISACPFSKTATFTWDQALVNLTMRQFDYVKWEVIDVVWVKPFVNDSSITITNEEFKFNDYFRAKKRGAQFTATRISDGKTERCPFAVYPCATNDGPASTQLSGGAIGGIVVGVVGGLAIVAFVAWYFWHRGRKSAAAPLEKDDRFSVDEMEGPDTTHYVTPLAAPVQHAQHVQHVQYPPQVQQQPLTKPMIEARREMEAAALRGGGAGQSSYGSQAGSSHYPTSEVGSSGYGNNMMQPYNMSALGQPTSPTFGMGSSASQTSGPSAPSAIPDHDQDAGPAQPHLPPMYNPAWTGREPPREKGPSATASFAPAGGSSARRGADE